MEESLKKVYCVPKLHELILKLCIFSCSSSDCESSSYAADRPGSGPGTSDQVVPPVGLADAAWDDTGRETPAPALLTQEPETEIRHEPSGWLDNDLKSSTTFLDDDVDDLGTVAQGTKYFQTIHPQHFQVLIHSMKLRKVWQIYWRVRQLPRLSNIRQRLV